MKVYRAVYYGFDPCHYIVAAKDLKEAIDTIELEGYGRPLEEDVWEILHLQTTWDDPTIIVQF